MQCRPTPHNDPLQEIGTCGAFDAGPTLWPNNMAETTWLSQHEAQQPVVGAADLLNVIFFTPSKF